MVHLFQNFSVFVPIGVLVVIKGSGVHIVFVRALLEMGDVQQSLGPMAPAYCGRMLRGGGNIVCSVSRGS